MNDTSIDKVAYVLYDSETLDIRHVSFTLDTDHGIGLSMLEIPQEQAMDLLSGNSRVNEHRITEIDGKLTLQKLTLEKPLLRFWRLYDLDLPISGGIFGSGESSDVPMQVSNKTMDGFDVRILGKIKNIVFYITMKNDPNYLLKTIDWQHLPEFISALDSIPVHVNLPYDYSIYVRYDAA